ncbi:hypothetical protein Aperf_G00000067443 [Anoplocephala perfoliata]
MKLEFVFLFCALALLTARTQPLDHPLRFPESWFEAPKPEVEVVPTDIFNVEIDESKTESTASTIAQSSAPTTTQSSTSTTMQTTASTPTASLGETETGTDLKTSMPVSTLAPTTTMAYTDEFHPDPFLAAAIKAAKSPIYQRLREPPPQNYNYDFLREM